MKTHDKFKKKIVVPITLILVGCCVAVTFILHDSLTKVDANVAFNGISNIIDAHGENSPFNIIEVVPSKDQASIGYLIDGQEPENWKKTISTITAADGTGKAARAKYLSTLKDKLASITTYQKDNSKPLYYEDYEESYVDGGDDWTQIDLANIETLPAETTGYRMEYAAGGNFEFATEYVPAVTDGNPSGKYDQNIDHYVYISEDSSDEDNTQRGYYGVVFKQVEIPAGSDAYSYFNPTDDTGITDRTAYKVKSAYAIVTEKSMTAIAKYDPHAAIYSVDNSNIDSPYIYVGQAENYNGEAENNSLGLLDFEKYTYYTLEMEYVPSDEVKNDVTYYEVDDEQPILFFEDKSGEYGAVLDEGEPYVKVYDESTDYPQMGHFDIKEGSQVYNYVGDGNGSYNIVEDASAKLDYPLNISKIYIKGGFKNNDWFRNGVFNQDSSDKSKNMTFNVQTVTPKEMDNINWSNVDLLYISGGDGSTSYSYDDDITGQTVFAVAKRAHETGFMMPVVVDYGLVENYVDSKWNFGNTTSIQRLAALLCCTNYDDLNIDSIDPNNYNNSWAVSWNSINFDKKISSSSYQNGYVNGNIYMIPKNTADSEAFLLRDFAAALTQPTDDDTAFQTDADSIGFGEIAEYINAENKIRKTENDADTGTKYEYFDKKISKDIILSYIISYADKRDIVNPTDSLNILDIEPGKVNDSSKALTYDKLKKWLGTNCPDYENVKITCITSSEFIGRIEDLNNYDMIYMGLVADNLNYDQGHTVYNDWNMDGLIYSNVGDIVVINPADTANFWGYDMLRNGHAGLLDNDYINNGSSLNNNLTLRKSWQWLGNSWRYDYNQDYVTAVNTYRGSGNDITTQKVSELEDYLKAGFPIVFDGGFFSSNYDSGINEYNIDNCANIYTFLNYAKSSPNVLKTNTSGTLQSVSGSADSQNLLGYLTNEKPEITLKEQEKVQGREYVEIKNNQIVLEFSISNSGGADENAKFNAQLYLDSNSDGKFSTTREEIAANKIRLYSNGTIVNPVLGEDGKYYYSLSAGSYNYKLVYDLPNGYVGVMPWQLRVSQATNSYRYDEKSGYVYAPNTKENPTKVNILQINSHLTGSFDMEQQKKNNTKFHELLDQVTDFDLNITTLYTDSDELKKICSNGDIQKYDMLVIGFGDCYSIDNDGGKLDAIKEYIESGKPVLFSHDTTSFCNNKNNNSYNNIWGYEFNTIIRDSVGLDRYGILTNTALKKGNTLKAGTDDYNLAVETAQKNKTDIAYQPRSNKQVIVRQNQGFTNHDLNHYQWADNGDKHGAYRLYSGISYDEGKTKKAVQVNSGQITNYPFKIDEEIQIAETHKQYYQLDMNQDSDDDGESDIVVWYTLADNQLYNISPKDVRNSYYIYTMGNVTYSGVGHSSVKNSTDELKLYINTMIAAYSATVHEPSIYLKESADVDSRDLTVLYSTIDDAVEQASENKADAMLDGVDNKQDVYFTVKDSNLVRNQIDDQTVVYMDFYIEGTEQDYDENLGSADNPIYVKKVNWDIYSLNDDGSENEKINDSMSGGEPRDYFENNRTYKLKVPVSILPSGSNSIKVYAVAYSKIVQTQGNGTKTTDSPKTYKTFQIQRTGLADLD